MGKLIIAAALALLFNTANAGFITGYALGSLGNSEGKAKSQPNSVAVFSEKHDVIYCYTYTGYSCYIGDGKQASPAQFAGMAGYKKIYSTGVVITPDNRSNLIVMEVSK